MARKAKKQSTERQTVGVRLPPALRDSLVAEAKRRRIRLAEEVRYRLAHYDELVSFANEVDDSRLGAMLNTRDDDMIDKLAERIAKKLKSE